MLFGANANNADRPGARRSWQRLLQGECGITSLRERGLLYSQLQCQVAGSVPESSKESGGWNPSEWLTRDVCLHIYAASCDPLIVWQEQRRMARFAQYGVVAAQEALEDSGWLPKSDHEMEMTVYISPQLTGVTLTCSRVSVSVPE